MKIRFFLAFLVLMGTGSGLILIGFIIKINWLAEHTIIDKLIYLNRFVVDFLQVGSVVIILFSNYRPARVLAWFFVLIFTFVYFVQSQSYETIGSLLPAIALENLDHIDFLDTDVHYYTGLVWIIIFSGFSVFFFRLNGLYPLKKRLFFAIFVMVFSLLIKNDKHYLSDKVSSERFSYYNSGAMGFTHASPLSKFKDTVTEYIEYMKIQLRLSAYDGKLSERSKKLINSHYPYFGKINESHPMVKDYIYQDALPFGILEGDKKNIIVFFIEGMSARVIQPYSQNFPNISPNIEKFSKHAIQVNNYYNHTYATYRGLGGELCSFYPIGRLLKETNYYCLPSLLRSDGYDTRFLFSQSSDKSALDELGLKAGFENIDSVETLFPLLNNGQQSDQKAAHERISDSALIEGLIYRLKEKEIAKEKKPFFMGLYNFETHTGIHLRSNNKTKYPYNGGSSYVLDTFYNFDKSFGVFWEYFVKSPYFDNTVLVLTSDHATFPSKDYGKLMKNDREYLSLFIDEIPLLIYHPQVNSRIVFDQGEYSSVDLAPSLAHILGVKNRKVPFFGRSIFDSNTTERPLLSGSGRVLYVKNRSYGWSRIKKGMAERPGLIEGFTYMDLILFCQGLEGANEVWPD